MANPKYRNGSEAKAGDKVYGLDKEARPFAGRVVSIDREQAELVIEPIVVRGVVARSEDCVKVMITPKARAASKPNPEK